MMNVKTTKDAIKVGDTVAVVLPQEYETRHAPGILGVVKKIYYGANETTVNAYGVEASGELVYYLADQIAKVDTCTETQSASDLVNRVIENIIYDSILSSYDGSTIKWPDNIICNRTE